VVPHHCLGLTPHLVVVRFLEAQERNQLVIKGYSVVRHLKHLNNQTRQVPQWDFSVVLNLQVEDFSVVVLNLQVQAFSAQVQLHQHLPLQLGLPRKIKVLVCHLQVGLALLELIKEHLHQVELVFSVVGLVHNPLALA